jgi:hypothetical protein
VPRKGVVGIAPRARRKLLRLDPETSVEHGFELAGEVRGALLIGLGHQVEIDRRLEVGPTSGQLVEALHRDARGIDGHLLGRSSARGRGRGGGKSA